jgi:LPS-assembly protein
MSKSFWLLVFLFSFVPVVQAQLKLQYDPLEKMEGDEKPALHLEAQQITGTKYRGWLLQGESEIRQASSLLRASLIDYDEIRQELVAQGNVRLATGGNVLDSRSIRMRFPTGEGDAQDASFFIRSVQVRGRASEADFQVDHHLKLKNVAYTNCPAGNDDWLLTASELNMDYVGQKGHAIFPVLRFKGVPIFALPYIEFPLGSERRSGFLAPALGTGDSVGRYVNIPYYWNISPSQDATITPKFFSERGLLSEVQYRYLAPNFGGTLQVEQISDRVQKKSRWFLLSEHQQTLFPNALLFWNYKKTSDTTYLSDLGLTQEQTGQTALRQEFGTQYTTPLTKTMLRTLGFQSLGTASVADQEYSRKPQLLFQFQKSDTDNFDWGADLDYNQFRHPTKVEADRFVGQLSTGYTIKKSWGFLSPKLKMNLSQYRVFGLGTRDVSRSQSLSIPQFSVDSGLFFDRNFTWFGQDIRQSFEPRLVYQYTPYRDQSQLPVFDTATTNFNFTSIFSDNVYTGKDRVVNANQVTLGAQTRFFSRWDSTELIRLALARRFYFTEQKVSLPGEVVRVSKDSDYLGAASVNLGSRWQADAAVQLVWRIVLIKVRQHLYSKQKLAGSGKCHQGGFLW